MEILLLSLLGGLFVCGMFSLRILIEHETDQILKAVMDDYEPETEPVSVPAMPQKSPSLILQQSNKQNKD